MTAVNPPSSTAPVWMLSYIALRNECALKPTIPVSWSAETRNVT